MDIQPIFGEAGRLLAAGEPFVLATVVNTKGSTPQKPGAKLLVRADGTMFGTLGGGCVEADVMTEARIILEEQPDGAPQLRQFVLNEDIAARDGLVCGGTMEILIDPVAGHPELAPLFDEILAAFEGQGDRALATLAEPGTSAGRPEAKLFIRDDGGTVGGLGAPDLDEAAVDAALDLMPKGREVWLTTDSKAKIYVETFTRPATIVIVGGGHVGYAVYKLATFLGYATIIVDDREMFANAERFPEAKEIVVGDFAEGVASLDLTPNSYVLVATRGHKYDDAALLAAARSKAGYVGLLGSKRKAAMIFRRLFEEGIDSERIGEIRAPVGLDIGGRSPEEIAVSVMAEVLAVRHGKKGGVLKADRLLPKAKQLAGRA